MNICFFGVGGVGGYYGTILSKYFNTTATLEPSTFEQVQPAFFDDFGM